MLRPNPGVSRTREEFVHLIPQLSESMFLVFFSYEILGVTISPRIQMRRYKIIQQFCSWCFIFIYFWLLLSTHATKPRCTCIVYQQGKIRLTIDTPKYLFISSYWRCRWSIICAIIIIIFRILQYEVEKILVPTTIMGLRLLFIFSFFNERPHKKEGYIIKRKEK